MSKAPKPTTLDELAAKLARRLDPEDHRHFGHFRQGVTVITGESKLDRIFREAREAVRATRLRGEHDAYDHHGWQDRRRFDVAVGVEIDRRLAAEGMPHEIGLATPESIAHAAELVRKMSGRPEPTPVAKVKNKRNLSRFHEAVRQSTKRIVGDAKWTEKGEWCTVRPKAPGSIVVRVPVKKDGVARDREEAVVDFAHEEWAPHARYLGTVGHEDKASEFLFERPDPVFVAKLRQQHSDALESIRQYRVQQCSECTRECAPGREKCWACLKRGERAARKARKAA